MASLAQPDTFGLSTAGNSNPSRLSYSASRDLKVPQPRDYLDLPAGRWAKVREGLDLSRDSSSWAPTPEHFQKCNATWTSLWAFAPPQVRQGEKSWEFGSNESSKCWGGGLLVLRSLWTWSRIKSLKDFQSLVIDTHTMNKVKINGILSISLASDQLSACELSIWRGDDL